MEMEYDYYLNFLRNKNEFNIFAFILRSSENTAWNHLEISKVPKKRPTEATGFYSAVIPESRRIKESEILKHYSIIKRRKLTLIVSDKEADAILNKYLGKKYSIFQNLVIAIKLSFNCLRKYFSTVKPNLDKYLNCTEFCARFLEEACGKKFKSTEVISLKDLDSDAIGELVLDDNINKLGII